MINIDETAMLLEINFFITIDFKGNKKIYIEINGKKHYGLTAILIATGCTKFASLVIQEGDPGKTVETNLGNLLYVKINNMFIYCQNNSWCNHFYFWRMIQKKFLNFMKKIKELNAFF